MQNRVGQQFGTYRLLQLLGRGGFAEVYLGEHILMQSKAAVKVLYGPLATSEAQRFLHEARTLDRLEHTNIVGIKEFAIQQGIPFLVMNYASNGTLHQRHPRGQPLLLETIVPYVQQIASALQYAHDRQIVHRDVKPENMLIDNNGTILLSDFGIAILFSSAHSSTSKGLIGTYAYMAPEQITGKALPASDQYALGIVVYEWLCGEAPFVGSAAEVTAKHLHAPPPLFHEKGIAIEPQVEMVIKHALEKDPRQRFASVWEFALALQSSSNAQRSKSIYAPSSGGNNSILPSPSPKTPGFTYPSSSSPPSIPPRLTPHITHTVQPSISGIPPSPIPPTISPGNIPYAPTQPAPHSVQPRKTGSPCLAITVISVVILLLIVSGSIFASQFILRGATPTQAATATPTQAATATPTQTATAPPTQAATATPTQAATAPPTQAATAPPTPMEVAPPDPNEIDAVKTFVGDFCSDLYWREYQDAYDNRMSVKYTTDHPDESKFTQEPFFSGGGCGYDKPGIVNNIWTVILHVGPVDSPTNYTATIIHDPKSKGDLRVNTIQ